MNPEPMTQSLATFTDGAGNKAEVVAFTGNLPFVAIHYDGVFRVVGRRRWGECDRDEIRAQAARMTLPVSTWIDSREWQVDAIPTPDREADALSIRGFEPVQFLGWRTARGASDAVILRRRVGTGHFVPYDEGF